jgi:uncharacterized integral membrane protein
MSDAPPTKLSRQRVGQVVTFGLGVLATLFAALNLDQVDVNWIVATWETPLIVVIVVSLVLGAGLGYFFARRRSRGPPP